MLGEDVESYEKKSPVILLSGLMFISDILRETKII